MSIQVHVNNRNYLYYSQHGHNAIINNFNLFEAKHKNNESYLPLIATFTQFQHNHDCSQFRSLSVVVDDETYII